MSRVRRLPSPIVMYRALVERDEAFDGVFFAGVKSTKIFCRSTCSARKPKKENVEFFADASSAERAGYRACKRCKPLEAAGERPAWVARLLSLLEKEPGRRISDDDLRALSIEPARARRHFKEHFGMTFQGYQRARRLGFAQHKLNYDADLAPIGGSARKTIVALAGDLEHDRRLAHVGESIAEPVRGRVASAAKSTRISSVASAAKGTRVSSVSNAVHEAGYESESGFRDAFRRMFGAPPSQLRATSCVHVSTLPSPVGLLISAATREGVCMLEFADRKALMSQAASLKRWFDQPIVPGMNERLEELHAELAEYFAKEREQFSVPLEIRGTPFQREVWDRLLAIPFGETRSYRDIAIEIGNASAVRAVGRTNGLNRISIVIPCHRVVRDDGTLCGYGGGLWRKRWLLDHEQTASTNTQRSATSSATR
jgi:AraC family transcriptional regulator of adaptative response/methylated-DNA-[protein]-cysteine methyltransferase